MPLGEGVLKGSFSIPATGERVPLMFNPATIRDQQGIAYPDQSVPGMSHPVTQYGGGGPRLITFELYLDGDRGTFGDNSSGRLTNYANPTTPNNERVRTSAFSNPDAPSKSIQAELDFYRSLRYPAQVTGDGLAQIHPHRVLFSFGPLFQGVECVVQQVDIEVTYWSSNLEPIRATLQIILKEVVASSVPRNRVFSNTPGGG